MERHLKHLFKTVEFIKICFILIIINNKLGLSCAKLSSAWTGCLLSNGYNQCSCKAGVQVKINFHGWLGGWLGGVAGKMKNKAKLSLNRVWAGTLADLGQMKFKDANNLSHLVFGYSCSCPESSIEHAKALSVAVCVNGNHFFLCSPLTEGGGGQALIWKFIRF